MSQEQSLTRFFGGNLFGGGFFIFIIILFLLGLGEDLLEWVLCNEEVLIWIILIMLFLNVFDFGDGCC